MAVVFLALASYAAVEYFLLTRKQLKITLSGYLRAGMLAGIVITGLLLVVKNLTGTHFASGLIIFLDLAHLGLVMSFLATAFACLALKKKWTIAV